MKDLFTSKSLFRQQRFSYLGGGGGGGWDFFEKNILMAKLTEKKIIFCTEAEKNFMLSPAWNFFFCTAEFENGETNNRRDSETADYKHLSSIQIKLRFLFIDLYTLSLFICSYNSVWSRNIYKNSKSPTYICYYCKTILKTATIINMKWSFYNRNRYGIISSLLR